MAPTTAAGPEAAAQVRITAADGTLEATAAGVVTPEAAVTAAVEAVATRVRSLLAGLTLAGLALLIAGAIIWLSGGFNVELLDIRLRATDPLRPIVLGAGLLAIRALLYRRVRFDAEASLAKRISRPSVIATSLAILIACTAMVTNYGIAGGADSYGYVSQADLWLEGDLTVEYDWIREAPWPKRQRTATPLGYRPSPTGGDFSVPSYAPGLPLMFAGSKLLFGQCGIVIVIALMTGVLVGTTYAIGRRVASPQIGAAAAWLVATCPVVIFMMAEPMSDIPAAAMCAASVLCSLHRSKSGSFLAGLAMAAVTLIRPNLAPLVAVLGLWMLLLDRHSSGWPNRINRCLLFGLGVAPGAVFLASFNASLYESAFAAGYGSLDGFFSASYILPNIRNYTVWLASTQTPLVLLGIAALAIPTRWLGKREGIDDASLLFAMAAGVFALYLPYTVFGAWWFLRFFLPVWPAFAIGTAWLLTSATGRTYGRLGLTALVLTGGWGLSYAATHEAFRVGWGDLRYVSAAHVVRELTRPGSVILSMQHSGTGSYYGGRHTLRYDWIEPQRLESVILWLKERGHDVYILVEEWEAAGFRERFKGTPYGALDETALIFRQDVGTRVLLFDTRSHEGEMARTITDFVRSVHRCPLPQPLTGSLP